MEEKDALTYSKKSDLMFKKSDSEEMPNCVRNEKKIKFILNAIENGFSVKKYSKLNNTYEFSIDQNKFLDPQEIHKKSKQRRSISLPVSKHGFFEKIFG